MMGRISGLFPAAALLFRLFSISHAGTVEFKPLETIFGNGIVKASSLKNATLPNFKRGPSKQERELERQARRKRHLERKARLKDTFKDFQPSSLEEFPKEDFDAISEDHPTLRALGWGKGNSGSNAVQFADAGAEYDKWQQAYRMLGGFIDCDHDKDSEGSHDKEENNDGDQSGCSRWMLWAAYVDPNYQGNEYDEYFGDNPTGRLDCHDPNTEWELLGVYRQEFYQFIEQISKHLWAIDDYEYVVALAGLAYMTDYDCFYVGASNGVSIYAGVAPQPKGEFMMALYTDEYCLTPDDSLGLTFDDFGLYSDVQLQSGDGGDNYDEYNYAYEWWQDSQEYKLANLNAVYDEFRYCTSCVDYPTYQDGYFIGDDGTDDDDLINQCWKFYSHDSFTCEADCVALAHSQGTILSVTMGDKTFGETLTSFYGDGAPAEYGLADDEEESRWSRLLANAFVTFSFVVFIATFLAFALARRARYRASTKKNTSSSKRRRLLDGEDDDGGERRSSSGRRRSSRGAGGGGGTEEEGDGLFRTSTNRKKSPSRSRSASKRSKSRSRNENKDYEPPKSSRRGRSSGKRTSSKSRRKPIDDF